MYLQDKTRKNYESEQYKKRFFKKINKKNRKKKEKNCRKTIKQYSQLQIIMSSKSKKYESLNRYKRLPNTGSSPVTIGKPIDPQPITSSPTKHSIFSPTNSPVKRKPSYKRLKVIVHSDDLHLFESNSPKKHGSYLEMSSPVKASKAFDLIDVKALEKSTPSPEKTRKPAMSKSDEFKIEGLIEVSDDDDDDDGGKSSKTTGLSSFVEKLDPKNLLHSLEEHNKDKYKDVLQKYKRYNIPKPIKYKSKLLERADKHMKVIRKILEQKQEPSSYYYLARKQCYKSKHETMSAQEKWSIEWESYFGGYYGFQRQSIIGSYILEKYENKLLKFSNGNKTVSYWTVPQFSTYVLANEIIIRMIMEDMNMDFKEAETFCQKTTDYGTMVADAIEVVNEEYHESESETNPDDSDVILVPSKKRKV